MHNHLARYHPQRLSPDERVIQHDEELLVALEELDALKESLDTSYRAYRRTPTPLAGMTLVEVMQQTLVAICAVGIFRGEDTGNRR